MPENLTSRPPQTTYIALQLSWLQQKPSFDGIQAGNSTEWKKLAYNNINLAAGQLQIAANSDVERLARVAQWWRKRK